MIQTEPLDQDPVFQLKGSMLAITVLELARNDLENLDRQLAAKVAQAPNFFSNAPLVLALDKLPASEGAVDLPGLMRVCRPLLDTSMHPGRDRSTATPDTAAGQSATTAPSHTTAARNVEIEMLFENAGGPLMLPE